MTPKSRLQRALELAGIDEPAPVCNEALAQRLMLGRGLCQAVANLLLWAVDEREEQVQPMAHPSPVPMVDVTGAELKCDCGQPWHHNGGNCPKRLEMGSVTVTETTAHPAPTSPPSEDNSEPDPLDYIPLLRDAVDCAQGLGPANQRQAGMALTAVRETIVDARAERDTLRALLVDKENRLQQALDDGMWARKERDEHGADCDTLRSRVEEWEQSFSAAQTRIEQLEGELTEARAELTRLKELLQDWDLFGSTITGCTNHSGRVALEDARAQNDTHIRVMHELVAKAEACADEARAALTHEGLTAREWAERCEGHRERALDMRSELADERRDKSDLVDAARDVVEAFLDGRVSSSGATLSRLRAALSALDRTEGERPEAPSHPELPDSSAEAPREAPPYRLELVVGQRYRITELAHWDATPHMKVGDEWTPKGEPDCVWKAWGNLQGFRSSCWALLNDAGECTWVTGLEPVSDPPAEGTKL